MKDALGITLIIVITYYPTMLVFLPSVHTTLMCEDNYECDSAGTARLDSETYVPLSNQNHYQIWMRYPRHEKWF